MPISFRGWVNETRSDIADGRPLKYTFLKAGLKAYNGISHTVTSRYPIGTNIFEREWDALLVLDACRVDALREVSDEYRYLSDVGSLLSVGSSSHEWTAKTFTQKYLEQISETAYVSANPFSERSFIFGERPPYSETIPFGWPKWNMASADDFAHMDFVTRYGNDYQYNVADANYVTDRAITTVRELSPKKLIVHYFQPHEPYLARALKEGRELTQLEREPFEAFARGEASRDLLWELYLENLRHVLDSIDLLLTNLDLETVVLTADHGELFGEMGAYGHPEGFPHPDLKYVPWAETTATDSGEYYPNIDLTKQRNSDTPNKKLLRDLGYI